MFPLTLYLEDASLSLSKENDKLSNGKTGKKFLTYETEFVLFVVVLGPWAETAYMRN